MDFDEFCLALRFVYASINGEIAEIPAQLPPQMIPASKAHYFGGNQGYGNQSYMSQAHMSPAQSYSQSANYSAIADLVCDNLAARRRALISSWKQGVVGGSSVHGSLTLPGHSLDMHFQLITIGYCSRR